MVDHQPAQVITQFSLNGNPRCCLIDQSFLPSLFLNSKSFKRYFLVNHSSTSEQYNRRSKSTALLARGRIYLSTHYVSLEIVRWSALWEKRRCPL